MKIKIWEEKLGKKEKKRGQDSRIIYNRKGLNKNGD
jgi:hypothetical protein